MSSLYLTQNAPIVPISEIVRPEAAARVTVRAKLQMPNFVGYGATQNDADLEFGVVTLGATHRIFVVDTGENRNYCKTLARIA